MTRVGACPPTTMQKLNAKQERKIKKLDEKWSKQTRTSDLVFKRIKKDVKEFMNSLMFNKKPRTTIDKIEHYLVWWTKIIVIFCALSYITGR